MVKNPGVTLSHRESQPEASNQQDEVPEGRMTRPERKSDAVKQHQPEAHSSAEAELPQQAGQPAPTELRTVETQATQQKESVNTSTVVVQAAQPQRKTEDIKASGAQAPQQEVSADANAVEAQTSQPQVSANANTIEAQTPIPQGTVDLNTAAGQAAQPQAPEGMIAPSGQRTDSSAWEASDGTDTQFPAQTERREPSEGIGAEYPAATPEPLTGLPMEEYSTATEAGETLTYRDEQSEEDSKPGEVPEGRTPRANQEPGAVAYHPSDNSSPAEGERPRSGRQPVPTESGTVDTLAVEGQTTGDMSAVGAQVPQPQISTDKSAVEAQSKQSKISIDAIDTKTQAAQPQAPEGMIAPSGQRTDSSAWEASDGTDTQLPKQTERREPSEGIGAEYPAATPEPLTGLPVEEHPTATEAGETLTYRDDQSEEDSKPGEVPEGRTSRVNQEPRAVAYHPSDNSSPAEGEQPRPSRQPVSSEPGTVDTQAVQPQTAVDTSTTETQATQPQAPTSTTVSSALLVDRAPEEVPAGTDTQPPTQAERRERSESVSAEHPETTSELLTGLPVTEQTEAAGETGETLTYRENQSEETSKPGEVPEGRTPRANREPGAVAYHPSDNSSPAEEERTRSSRQPVPTESGTVDTQAVQEQTTVDTSTTDTQAAKLQAHDGLTAPSGQRRDSSSWEASDGTDTQLPTQTEQREQSENVSAEHIAPASELVTGLPITEQIEAAGETGEMLTYRDNPPEMVSKPREIPEDRTPRANRESGAAGESRTKDHSPAEGERPRSSRQLVPTESGTVDTQAVQAQTTVDTSTTDTHAAKSQAHDGLTAPSGQRTDSSAWEASVGTDTQLPTRTEQREQSENVSAEHIAPASELVTGLPVTEQTEAAGETGELLTYRDNPPEMVAKPGEIPEDRTPRANRESGAAGESRTKDQSPAEGERLRPSRQSVPSKPGTVETQAVQPQASDNTSATETQATQPQAPESMIAPSAQQGDKSVGEASVGADTRTPARTERRERSESVSADHPEITSELLTGLPVTEQTEAAGETGEMLTYRDNPPEMGAKPGEVPEGRTPRVNRESGVVGESRTKDQSPGEGERPRSGRQPIPSKPGTAETQAAQSQTTTNSSAARTQPQQKAPSSTTSPSEQRTDSPAGEVSDGTGMRMPKQAQHREQSEGRAKKAFSAPSESLTGLPVTELPPEAGAGLDLAYRETQSEDASVPGMPSESGSSQTAREIGRQTAPQGEIRVGMELEQPAEHTGEEPPSDLQNAVPGTGNRSTPPWRDPIKLTYAQMTRTEQTEPAQGTRQETPTGQNDPPGFQNLPPWAQDMLRRTGGIPDHSFSDPNAIRFDAGRNGFQSGGMPPGRGATPQVSFGNGRQITWSAPGVPLSGPSGMSLAGSPAQPTQMVFREQEKKAENAALRNQGMDEREIRKTADKVYRLIEERLRKELRRGGR